MSSLSFQKPAHLREPAFHLGEAFGVEAVDPALAVDAHLHQAGFAQGPEMLGDGRRADREMLADRAGGALAAAEQLDDLEPGRIGQGGELVHSPIIKSLN